MTGETGELEDYGVAVVDALLRPGLPPLASDHAQARRALLEASGRVDKASLARFGASFLAAYPRPRGPEPATPEPAPPPPAPEPPAEPPLPPSMRLSMQEYAALRAECMTARVATLGDVRARFGLDAAGDKREVASWGRAFGRDPTLFERYKALFQELRKHPAAVSPATAVAANTPVPPPPPPPAPPSPGSSEPAEPPPPEPQAALAPLVLPARPGERRLSVHQYAALRADCVSAAPDEVGQVRARHGLDAASDAVEVEAWRVAFAREPGLFEQYMRLFAYFRSMSAAPGDT